jgi:Tol biopolymer transport system component
MPVAEQVSNFSASATGVLVYQVGAAGLFVPMTTPTWYDRKGTVLGKAAEPGSYLALALSPDDKRLAFTRRDDSQTEDLWLLEFANSGTTRFTFGPGQSLSPVWSPDGNTIVFMRDGGPRVSESNGLYQKASSQTGSEALLLKFHVAINTGISGWSPDGRYLLLTGSGDDPKKESDVFVLPMRGPKGEKSSAPPKPIPLISTEFNEQWATFSPDGRWIAYSSDASGQNEIYVRPFDPASPEKTSSAGLVWTTAGWGSGAHWPGKELFYTAPGGNVVAVEVATTPTFKPGPARQVFSLSARARLGDVTSDGKRFLVLVPTGRDAPPMTTPYSVVLNWTAVLRK